MSTVPVPASEPPHNVLLIVTDDMRTDGLAAMPTVQALAARGVDFTRAYATTPLCFPSRASILTGRYARNHGVHLLNGLNGGYEAFDDRSALATWAQAAGVRTGLVGRYLNEYHSEAVPPGWDFWFALWQGGKGYYNFRANDHGETEFYPEKPENYSTRILEQQVLRFLKTSDDRPFLLLLTPRAPHGPATPDPLDEGAFASLEPSHAPSFDEADVSDKPRWIREKPPLTEKERSGFHTLRQRQLETLRGLDRSISSIVEQLRVDGRLERTWIIFTSDNGLAYGEHRLSDKSCPYEECARVPLIVVPPGGLALPRVDEHLVANIDLAPTIAEILRLQPDGPIDGRSLLPLIADPATPWREALILEGWAWKNGVEFVGLRTADRKYVRYPEGDEELYDELADPYELENLAAHPDWAAEKARLAALLDTLLADPPTE